MERCLPFLVSAVLVAGSFSAWAQSKPTDNAPAKPGPKDPLVDPEDRGGAGGKWGGRRGGRRRLGRVRAAAARAISDGLKWLAGHQDDDGGWSATGFMRHDKTGKRTDRPGEHIGRIGTTSLCLLTFLGDGSTLQSGPYKKAVEKATRWLLMRQKANGTFTIPDNNNLILEHALATYAFCESCGLSRSEVIRPWATRAASWLAKQQNDDGGFSATRKGAAADAFTTCHALLALKTAKDFRILSGGWKRHRKLFDDARKWLDKVTTEDGSVTAVGDVRIADGSARKESAVAALLFSRFFIGQDPKRVATMVLSADKTLSGLPADADSAPDPVLGYLGSCGIYQMGGRYWIRWQHQLMKAIVNAQREDMNFAGSWDPVDKGGLAGGRVYATALSVLTLETYYRFTRLVR